MALSGRRLTLALAALLGSVVIVGAAAAFAVGRVQHLAGNPTGTGSAVSSTGSAVSSTDSTDSAVEAQTRTSGRPDGSATPPRSSGTTATTDSRPDSHSPTSTPPGPVPVAISPRAQASPHAQEVVDLLGRYFTSINRRDYDAWLTTVSTAQAKRDRDDWITSYSTTQDSGIYVSDITGKVPNLLVRMQFVSHQAVEDAPKALPLPCVRWDVTYQVVDEGPGLRVGNSAQPPTMAPCT